MPPTDQNPFRSQTIAVDHQTYHYYPLHQNFGKRDVDLGLLPFCIRILLENAIRHFDEGFITPDQISNLAHWSARPEDHGSISFTPARILLQDLTGVPLLVDLASLRSAAARAGIDPQSINPVIPVDLVIDHSVQMDFTGSGEAFSKNVQTEYGRNRERYHFLKWAQSSIRNFRVIPPASGIVHQINLEYLARVAFSSRQADGEWLYPDSVFGTDSHTPMINGIGVLGWGVGGIEATAAMLGQPVETLIPDVIGINIRGELKEGSSPTDLVLTLTHQLRKLGVVNKMVEFFGEGLRTLSVPDRAMLANMAPEYGATCAYFPVDQEVLEYLRLTGKSDHHLQVIEKYFKTQGLFRTPESPIPTYTQVVELALDQVLPSLAGPKRPQDHILLGGVREKFLSALSAPIESGGYGQAQWDPGGAEHEIQTIEHGSVVIAAITSCTNTSSPFAMISAGLLAKKAAALGLRPKPYVKTSLAPGSKAVMDYLSKAGLVDALSELGFQLSGYGCATCIGNSGPLDVAVSAEIQERHLITASVISGNRNFEGRVHPLVQANFLASPALVVAYALCGNVRVNLLTDPIGTSKDGTPVMLKDLWPSNNEVLSLLRKVVSKETYERAYAHLFEGDENWQSIPATPSTLYPWEKSSTYILESPFCDQAAGKKTSLENARILAIFGDSITTDHISPAGAISPHSPAASYLSGKGIAFQDFNTYGARRGNHEVMVRGTFANDRIKNRMLPGKEGGLTLHFPDRAESSIFEAAQKYQREFVDLVILAGKEYGTGSSRDWAAKGPLLLGVRAIIAQSFERIHRSNLVGMGILPLQFQENENPSSLGLDGSELLSISDLTHLNPNGWVEVSAKKSDHRIIRFQVQLRLNSEKEIRLWSNGGILRSIST
ncbi:MAG: aconitate hydratase AcnA [Chloroflexi bacterium]|nr:aconitate hydratase AcnA [Chloroflexota bacterium]